MVTRQNSICVALSGSHETIAKLDEEGYYAFGEKLKSILPPAADPTQPEQGIEQAYSQLNIGSSVRNADGVSSEEFECPLPIQIRESIVQSQSLTVTKQVYISCRDSSVS
jgi:hypothetical protein